MSARNALVQLFKTILNYYTTNIQSSNSNHNNNKLFISDPDISQVHSTAAASFHIKVNI